MYYVFTAKGIFVNWYMTEKQAKYQCGGLQGWYYTTKFDASSLELKQILNYEERYKKWKESL